MGSGLTLNPMMMAFDAEASMTSVSVIVPTAAVDDPDLDFHSSAAESRSSASCEGLDRAVDVALEDDAELLDLARLDLLVEIGQRDPDHRRDLVLPLLAGEGDLARLPLVGDGQQRVAGRRDSGQPEDLDRVGGPGLLHRWRRSLNMARTRP